MRKLKLAIASLISLVLVSNETQSKHYPSAAECQVVVVMDEKVDVIHDIVLFKSSGGVERMVSKYPKNSRFYKGIATNLKSEKSFSSLSIEIDTKDLFFPGDQFLPGGQYIPGDQFLKSGSQRSFKNDIAISGSVMEKLTGQRSKGLPVRAIEKMKVKRSDKIVTVIIMKRIDQT